MRHIHTYGLTPPTRDSVENKEEQEEEEDRPTVVFDSLVVRGGPLLHHGRVPALDEVHMAVDLHAKLLFCQQVRLQQEHKGQQQYEAREGNRCSPAVAVGVSLLSSFISPAVFVIIGVRVG